MRAPNPWVWIPVLVGVAVGAVIGFVVTRLTCLPQGCLGWQLVAGALTGLGIGFGILVVVVLTIRSLDEWRSAEAAGTEPPGVGCENPDSSD